MPCRDVNGFGKFSEICFLLHSEACIPSRVSVPPPLDSHTRLRIAVLKSLARVRALWRRPFRKKYEPMH